MLALGRARSAWPLALALAVPALLAPSLAAAQDAEDSPPAEEGGWEDVLEEDDDEEDDEFDTSWFGVRIGAWHRPTFSFEAEVSGHDPGLLTGLLGDSIDVERDLGLTENPTSEYLVDFDENAVLELEVFFDTRLVSVAVWWIAPFEYSGSATATREFNFGGFEFGASREVESRFRQWFAGVDLELNVFNNRYLRVSPLVSLRAIGIDWQVEDVASGRSGDTSDIASPLSYEAYELLPYPEVGIHVAVGYRDYLDVSLTLAGSVINYLDLEGSTFRAEAAVTVYPIPYLGIQVGGRSMSWHIGSASEESDEQFDIDMDFVGWTAGIVIRLG